MSSPEPAVSLDDRIDIACDRFEQSWGSDTPLAIEDLLKEFSQSECDSAVRELLGVELELRLKDGETFRKEDYLNRLPDHSKVVSDLFDTTVELQIETTSPVRSSDQAIAQPRRESSAKPPGPEMIGRYRIVEALDRGGQATVYRAIHPELGRDVVIKFCHVEKSTDPESQEALASEGRVLASLEHPNLARVYDFDFHENRAFLVMEFVRGLNLYQHRRQTSPQPEAWIPLVRQVAQALAYVHQQGVLHLDIKPQNILIDQTGTPRLIDFGLARADTVWEASGPDPAMLSGTLAYMAPEQARCDGESVGPASDVFGLGGVMYFLACGKPPIAGSDFDQVLSNARSGDWNQQLLNEKCDGQLRDLISAALAPKKDERLQSSSELADRLSALESKPGLSSNRKLVIAAGATCAALLLAMILLSPLQNNDVSQRDVPPASDVVPPSDIRSGEMRIDVWRNEDTFALVDAVPVLNGDRVEVRSEIPAGTHVSLFLFDSAGDLQLVQSVAAASAPYEYRFPENSKDREKISGPPGTEFVFLCGRKSGPVTVDELRTSGLFDESWPQLPEDAVIQIRSEQVEFLQRSKGFGGSVETIVPQQLVYDQLKSLRAKLETISDFVEGIAFSHFE